uniref:Exonuclease domain-containing protein n=1 Tax=Opuntia streptacantha TaxID=393608 RepID=A0A7C9DRN9_OPUST
MDPGNDASLIVFFDLETTMPPDRTIIEFGAILVCPRKLVEKSCYSTLVRPDDLSVITPDFESKGITLDNVANAPSLVEIADRIFNLLHGRTWAGHNIEEFDWARIKEAFQKIGRQPPEPTCTIDTYPLLEETFGRRAGDMKLATLASYFELGEQRHRSLDDARMALQVFKNCGAVLFLESKFPEVVEIDAWFSPDDIYLPSINVSLTPFYCGKPKIQILHNDFRLKLHCARLNVHYEPRSSSPSTFVVDAPESLCGVLNWCHDQAYNLFKQSGSTSKWNDVITVYGRRDTVRLRMRRHKTEIIQLNRRTGAEQRMRASDDWELMRSLFDRGTCIDAFFLVDTYDHEEQAGIGLVAQKLVVYS